MAVNIPTPREARERQHERIIAITDSETRLLAQSCANLDYESVMCLHNWIKVRGRWVDAKPRDDLRSLSSPLPRSLSRRLQRLVTQMLT